MGRMFCRSRRMLLLLLLSVLCLILHNDITALLESVYDEITYDPEQEELQSRISEITEKTCKFIDNEVPFINHTQPCDVKSFIYQVNSIISGEKRPIPRYLLRGCEHVFYNRVPKCGSRSLCETFLKLGEQHGYTVMKKAMGLGRDPSERLYKIKPFIQMLETMKGRYITAKHLYFIDLLKMSKKPIMLINVLRDPLEQLISVYSWKRFGDASHIDEKHGPTISNSTMSLDDCVAIHGASGNCFFWHMLSFPFMCEYEAGCWSHQAPNETHLQRAKFHIDNSFLLVGITEDMTSFLSVLEMLLPQFFCGIFEIYEQGLDEYLAKFASSHKETISESTREFLVLHLKYHYELYYHARQRFYRIFQSLLEYV